MTQFPDPALPPWRVEVHERLASTQQLVKERLAAGADVDGLVVRALEQPAGLGRRGKAWASPPGGSYQTFALRDRWEGALRQPCLTLLLATQLAEALRDSGARATVKWPNDLYLGEGKLAGVLSEYVAGHLVVGIGVNVNNPFPATASALVGWELPFVHALVLEAARSALARHVAGTGLGLPERLAPLDHLAGRSVSVDTPRGPVAGTALGVAADGALVVRTPEGTVSVHDGSVASWERPAARPR